MIEFDDQVARRFRRRFILPKISLNVVLPNSPENFREFYILGRLSLSKMSLNVEFSKVLWRTLENFAEYYILGRLSLSQMSLNVEFSKVLQRTLENFGELYI